MNINLNITEKISKKKILHNRRKKKGKDRKVENRSFLWGETQLPIKTFNSERNWLDNILYTLTVYYIKVFVLWCDFMVTKSLTATLYTILNRKMIFECMCIDRISSVSSFTKKSFTLIFESCIIWMTSLFCLQMFFFAYILLEYWVKYPYFTCYNFYRDKYCLEWLQL